MKFKKEKLSLLLVLDICLAVFLVATVIVYWLGFWVEIGKSVLIVVGLIGTLFVVVSALQMIVARRISVELLASIALVASIIQGEWVSVALINLMITFARIFSRFVAIRSHSAIASLLKIRPVTAKIDRAGQLNEISIEQVKAGDLVIVELGDKIPVDGVITQGSGFIDQSSLTGESLPVEKKEGEEVYGATILVSGSLIVRVEKVGADTTFEKIIKLVTESQGDKARIHALGDLFAEWYLVGTLAVVLVVYFVTREMSLVLALLLVSCADDIAVATPLALSSAITHSAKHGAVIKGSDYLEGLAKVRTIIFDKTGTLTQGKLKVIGVYSFLRREEKTILESAIWGVAMSHHPVSSAISRYASEQGFSTPNPEEFKEYGGEGVIAKKGDDEIIVGRPSFLEKEGVKITALELEEIEKARAGGYSLVMVGLNKQALGFITLADELRPGLVGVMTKLKKLGIKHLVMLTGDNEKIAGEVARQIGITEFHASLLPADKLTYLRRYLNKKTKVAMVGDGVNDAPALTLVDIGIAMGAIGAPAAIESADIALMKDDLSQLPELVDISHHTLRVIYQNIVIWGVVNVIGLVLVFTQTIGPTGAATYNFLTDFIPIFNSLRLFRD
ncbi:MAG TPA: cation-translocating P-type ATPase [Candidatus Paceibacterota bacterium]|nr:cation-translocating P-type ATPase [Candidatus Paceibacterota bacterium]